MPDDAETTETDFFCIHVLLVSNRFIIIAVAVKMLNMLLKY